MEAILYTLAILFTKHLFVDFLWQPREIALGKGKSLAILSIHAAMHWVATTILLLVINATWFNISASLLLLIPVIDAGSHWIIDFCSTRTIRRFGWTVEDKKLWDTIGVDQYAHYIMYLVITAILLSGIDV